MTIRLEAEHAVETTRETPVAPALPAEKVLEEIRLDSQRLAREYLDEVVVPHGGE